MAMPGRSYKVAAAVEYRYGFNLQERSDEVAPGHTTALYWEYDSRTGGRWIIDPVCKPNESSYLCFSGNPIWFSDINGDDPDPPRQPEKKPDLSKVTTVENILKGKNFIALHSEIELPKKGFWNKLFGRTEKRSDAQFADYARCQVKQGDGSPTAAGSDNRVDTYLDETRQTDKSKLNLQKGVDIIVSNLKQGNAVMVGVLYNPTKVTHNPNAATNHYVTIVGMGTDKDGTYFSYYDNYSDFKGESVGADITKNKFRLTITSTDTYYFADRDDNIPLNGNREVKIGDKDAKGNSLDARYIITEVRPNSVRASSNSGNNSSGVPAY
jgi:hypothetical protein